MILQEHRGVMAMNRNHHDTSNQPKSMSEKVAEVVDRLHKGVTEYLESDKYKEILKTFSRFHHYSLNNSLLILMQRPDAEHVASYTTWKSLHRQVNQGEKGIQILCPAPYKITVSSPALDENGNPKIGKDGRQLTEERQQVMVGFKIGYTFDISQTSGRDLPEMVTELDGKVEKYSNMKEAIELVAPVPIIYSEIAGGAKGYFSPAEQEIRVKDSMSEAQTVKTLIHETVHSRLHNPQSSEKADHEFSREDKEIQAESIAYVVADHYGLDTSDYSIPYVAGWAGDEKKMMQNLEIIKGESSRLIEELDRALEQIQREKMTDAVYQAEGVYVEIRQREEEKSQWDYTIYSDQFRVRNTGTIEAHNIIRAAEAIRMIHDISGELRLNRHPEQIHNQIEAVNKTEAAIDTVRSIHIH